MAGKLNGMVHFLVGRILEAHELWKLHLKLYSPTYNRMEYGYKIFYTGQCKSVKCFTWCK